MSWDITQMLANLGESLDPMTRFVTGASYVMGIYFFYKALMILKVYGEMRMMSSTPGNMMGALVFLLVGSVFLYIPTGMRAFINTFFGYGSPLAYQQWVGTLLSGYGPYATAIVRLIQFAGVVWFVKGLTVLAYSTLPAAYPEEKKSAVSLGMVYVFAGILAVNFIGTANMVNATIERFT